MVMNRNERKTLIVYIALHLILAIYSLTGVFSKTASRETFFNFRFCVCYGVILLLLGSYAIVWQQIIKRIPLTLAYADKAVTVIWGMVWGVLFFKESITVNKVAGAVIVIAGVVLYSLEDHKKTGEEEKDK